MPEVFIWLCLAGGRETAGSRRGSEAGAAARHRDRREGREAESEEDGEEEEEAPAAQGRAAGGAGAPGPGHRCPSPGPSWLPSAAARLALAIFDFLQSWASLLFFSFSLFFFKGEVCEL